MSKHRPSRNPTAPAVPANWKVRNGRIRQSIARWCFDKLSVEQLARAAADMGLPSVELVEPKDWPLLKKHNLVCGLHLCHMFVQGLNNTRYHGELIPKLEEGITVTGDAGFPNVITFSGMQENTTDKQGKTNVVKALKKLAPLAEKKKVNICLEPLNTRVDVEMKGHPGYQCSTLEWAMEVIDRVGSPRVKLLLDIYHTQIMQGDLVTRIAEVAPHIGHVHIAGVPGRNNIDLPNQEVNYPAVMRALAANGYKGYVGQEWIPLEKTAKGQLDALRRAAFICDV